MMGSMMAFQTSSSAFKMCVVYGAFVVGACAAAPARAAGDDFGHIIDELAAQYRVEPALVKAVIRAESNFDAMATSPKGAMGLMQLMPDTARMHEVRNAYDATENIHGGVRHLSYLMNRYGGNLDLVLSAYNAGTRPVDAVRGIPRIPETEEYVRRVHLFHAAYREGEAKVAKPAAMIARIDLTGRQLDKVYGVPIVLRAWAAH